MRQLRYISDDTVAADILAHGEGQAGFRRLKARRLQNGSEIYRADDLVRHFDTDGRNLFRDRCDAHVDHTESQREVAREIGNTRQLDALFQFKVIPRDCRPAYNADNRSIDAEAADCILQTIAVYGDLVPRIARSGRADVEQIERRKDIFVCRVRIGLYTLGKEFRLFFDVVLFNFFRFGRV